MLLFGVYSHWSQCFYSAYITNGHLAFPQYRVDNRERNIYKDNLNWSMIYAIDLYL